MSIHQLRYSVLAGRFAVCRFPAGAAVPAWASDGPGFRSITRTSDELSVVCPEAQVPAGVKFEGGWTCFKLEGPFPFSQTGVLSSFLAPLAESAIPIFALSTFDTDYVLVKHEFQQRAVSTLQLAGHSLVSNQSLPK